MTVFDIAMAAVAALLLISVAASDFTSRFGVPGLLMFMVVGLLAGSEGVIPYLTGTGGIYFDDPFTSASVGSVALCLILFSGGLETPIGRVRAIWKRGASLATIGVVISCGTIGWFAHELIGIRWSEALLLGAILSSTDAAAVFGALKGRGLRVRDETRALLELESAGNDPLAVILTMGFIALATGAATSPWELVPRFATQAIVGTAVGFAGGRVASWILNRVRLEVEGLYPVVTVALAFASFGCAQLLGGSGFLAVYVAGLTLSSTNFLRRRTLLLLHDGLAWLSAVAMFLVLGLQAFPSRLAAASGEGVALALFLVFVARPAGVFLSLAFSGLGWRQKTLISWAGLRGSAPIVLATFPFLYGLANADYVFHLTFFAVVISLALQGPLLSKVAKWMEDPREMASLEPAAPGDLDSAEALSARLQEAKIVPESQWTGRPLIDLGLPSDSLVVLIQRGEAAIVPKGSSTLEPGDSVLFICSVNDKGETRARLEATRPTA